MALKYALHWIDRRSSTKQCSNGNAFLNILLTAVSIISTPENSSCCFSGRSWDAFVDWIAIQINGVMKSSNAKLMFDASSDFIYSIYIKRTNVVVSLWFEWLRLKISSRHCARCSEKTYNMICDRFLLFFFSRMDVSWNSCDVVLALSTSSSPLPNKRLFLFFYLYHVRLNN